MDDWQDAAFSSRHMHNRVGATHSKSKHHRPFDVRKVFGSYAVKCTAWQKSLDAANITQPEEQPQSPSLDLYRLTQNGGEGVIGELCMPAVLNAAVILAGSRASLQRVVDDVERTALKRHRQDSVSASTSTSAAEATNDDANQYPAPTNRFTTFEKNSFRSPKFWFRWNASAGAIPASPTTDFKKHKSAAATESGLGYIVFTGNDCRKFKGTINCASLKWKDVAITGHKIAPRPETDVPVLWVPGSSPK